MNATIESERPPIVADADGTLRVGGTRVTVDSVLFAFNEGSAAEEIVQQFADPDDFRCF